MKKWLEILKKKTAGSPVGDLQTKELKNTRLDLLEAMDGLLQSADDEKRDLTDTEDRAFKAGSRYLDRISIELQTRNDDPNLRKPANQPPSMSATYGEGANSDPPVWGGVGLRYDELFYGNRGAHIPNVEDPEQFFARAFSQRTMTTGVGVSGGFGVPEGFYAGVFNLALSQSICLPRCRIFPMSTSTLTIPALDNESQDEGWFGGIKSQWRAEGQAFDLKTPAFRAIAMHAHKNGLLINASSEILQDAPSLQATIGPLMVDGITATIDAVVINGDGLAKPLGILSSDCTINVNRAAASEVSYVDLSGMFARLHPTMIPGAIWIASPDVLPQFLTLQDPSSQYIWHPNTVAGVEGPTPGTMMGLPLFISDKTPALGTRGDVILTNLNYYALGIRQGAQVESTNAAYFAQDLVSFRCITRMDGLFLLDSPITPANSGDDLSCSVVLN